MTYRLQKKHNGSKLKKKALIKLMKQSRNEKNLKKQKGRNRSHFFTEAVKKGRSPKSFSRRYIIIIMLFVIYVAIIIIIIIIIIMIIIMINNNNIKNDNK